MSTIAVPVTARPVAYQLDPGHSFITFEVPHLDSEATRGSHDPPAGDVPLDRSPQWPRAGEACHRRPARACPCSRPACDRTAFRQWPHTCRTLFVAERFEFGTVGALTAPTGPFTLRGEVIRTPANRPSPVPAIGHYETFILALHTCRSMW